MPTPPFPSAISGHVTVDMPVPDLSNGDTWWGTFYSGGPCFDPTGTYFYALTTVQLNSLAYPNNGFRTYISRVNTSNNTRIDATVPFNNLKIYGEEPMAMCVDADGYVYVLTYESKNTDGSSILNHGQSVTPTRIYKYDAALNYIGVSARALGDPVDTGGSCWFIGPSTGVPCLPLDVGGGKYLAATQANNASGQFIAFWNRASLAFVTAVSTQSNGTYIGASFDPEAMFLDKNNDVWLISFWDDTATVDGTWLRRVSFDGTTATLISVNHALDGGGTPLPGGSAGELVSVYYVAADHAVIVGRGDGIYKISLTTFRVTASAYTGWFDAFPAFTHGIDCNRSLNNFGPGGTGIQIMLIGQTGAPGLNTQVETCKLIAFDKDLNTADLTTLFYGAATFDITTNTNTGDITYPAMTPDVNAFDPVDVVFDNVNNTLWTWQINSVFAPTDWFGDGAPVKWERFNFSAAPVVTTPKLRVFVVT